MQYTYSELLKYICICIVTFACQITLDLFIRVRVALLVAVIMEGGGALSLNRPRKQCVMTPIRTNSTLGSLKCTKVTIKIKKSITNQIK